MVVAFELDGAIIGTIRIVPMGYRITLIDALLEELGPSEPLVGGSWEVGRLVLAPEYRSDVDTLRHCLFLALAYASERAQVSNLYAACTPMLSRLYRRFGFRQVARDVPLRGTEKSYTLIRGGAAQMLDALSGKDTRTAPAHDFKMNGRQQDEIPAAAL
jgi:N-acyl-L-homoserine lactone synthetase